MKSTRLLLLAAMLTLISTASWTRAEALTCTQMCFQSYDECLAGCRGNGTCRLICLDELGACNQNCTK